VLSVTGVCVQRHRPLIDNVFIRCLVTVVLMSRFYVYLQGVFILCRTFLRLYSAPGLGRESSQHYIDRLPMLIASALRLSFHFRTGKLKKHQTSLSDCRNVIRVNYPWRK